MDAQAPSMNGLLPNPRNSPMAGFKRLVALYLGENGAFCATAVEDRFAQVAPFSTILADQTFSPTKLRFE